MHTTPPNDPNNTESPRTDQPPRLPDIISFRGNRGIFNILERIGTRYNEFGIILLEDSDGEKLHCIEREKRENAHDINLEVVSRWIKGEGKGPKNWLVLVGAIEDAGLSELAREIRETLEI